MIPYVIYSHTDYLPILRIQTDYNKGLGHRTLLINPNTNKNTEVEFIDILSQYDRVIYYDDSLPYASKLLECFKQLSDDYFVLLHEFDILLNVDEETLSKLILYTRTNNFDRIDLKHTHNVNSSKIIMGTPFSLIKADNPHDYIFNVNPSIWKRESLIELLGKFPYETYRSIECNVQEFCMKYNIFKLHAANYIECGWFFCLPFFKYLHITHSGKILPMNPEFMTPSQQSYKAVSREYIEMYQKYNMQDIRLKHYLP